MAQSDWGKSKECQWFQIEPGADVGDRTMGLCIEEKLQRFRLRVSGNSGCNVFTSGQVAHAAGSSRAPPIAVATR
jgi:hypothetical protein